MVPGYRLWEKLVRVDLILLVMLNNIDFRSCDNISVQQISEMIAAHCVSRGRTGESRIDQTPGQRNSTSMRRQLAEEASWKAWRSVARVIERPKHLGSWSITRGGIVPAGYEHVVLLRLNLHRDRLATGIFARGCFPNACYTCPAGHETAGVDRIKSAQCTREDNADTRSILFYSRNTPTMRKL